MFIVQKMKEGRERSVWWLYDDSDIIEFDRGGSGLAV